MRDRVVCGQQWRRRRDNQIFRVHMVHRAERLVELRSEEERLTVLFAELRRRYLEENQ